MTQDGPPFHGRPTRRLANGHVWLDVLATAGPRIVRLGLAGSTVNVLAETPDEGWETPHGRYELLGGHRLWFAPEDPARVAIPDGHDLTLTETSGGLRLTGARESATGLVRSMTIDLDPMAPSFVLRHEVRNVSESSVELAPWAITQLPLGGTVLLPQASATSGHHVRPNRMLVLWPYTSWEDARFVPRDGLLTLVATAGPSLKLGYYNDLGWVGYAHGGSLLVRRFTPADGATHPDLGCNVETYVGSRFLELELLGPLTHVGPGSAATLVERWELVATAVSDPRALAELSGAA
jgi:hypothetical protein